MNDIDIIRLTSGLLQFGVAWYALRIGRVFKSTLMGWLLFGALSVLALLNLFLAIKPLGTDAQGTIKVDIIYFLFCLVLLVGVMRFYSSLKNFLQVEGSERRALDEWESQVKEKWVELTKANERLRQTVNRLETEMAEQKRAQENLQAQLTSSRQSEQALQRAITGLQTEIIEREPTPPAPAPVEKKGEHPLSATPQNGEESRSVVAGADTEIIRRSEPEPVEENRGHPLITPSGNGEELQSAVGGPGTEMNERKPEPEPAGKNGECLLAAARKNQEEPWDTAFLSHRKVAGRKSTRTRRKKPAKAR